MVDLMVVIKNTIKKLNLNFTGNILPLPERVTEKIVEEYEGEGAHFDLIVEDASSVATDGPTSCVTILCSVS